MKILITTDWYKPVINGVVTSVLNLADGLRAKGHEVKVLTLANTIHAKTEENVYYIASVSVRKIYPNARLKLHSSKTILEELIAWSPDVIHSQCEFSTFSLAKKISAATGAPIIHTYHTVYEDYTHYFCPSRRVGRKIVKVFSNRIAEHTSALIVPSAKISDLLSGYDISVPLYVVPSGIRLDEYSQDNDPERRRLRTKLGIGQDELVLISVGRLAKEKNLEEIIRFMASPAAPAIRLLIVGGGPYLDDLRESTEALGMTDRVIFAGMASPNEIADYYKTGDIFVSASTSETQGLTYMEAMASGLAMLCRKDACLEDVITPGQNGFLYDSEENFISQLRKLIDDAALRNSLGDAARASVLDRYSIPTFASACEQIYEKYLA